MELSLVETGTTLLKRYYKIRKYWSEQIYTDIYLDKYLYIQTSYLQRTSKRRQLYENNASRLMLTHGLYKSAIDGPVNRKH